MFKGLIHAENTAGRIIHVLSFLFYEALVACLSRMLSFVWDVR